MEQLKKLLEKEQSYSIILLLDVKNSGLNDGFLFENAMRFLPLEWQAQVLRKKLQQDKFTALSNKLLQLFGCSIATGLYPDEISFQYETFGKPILKGFDNISFNMSNGQEFTSMCLLKDAFCNGIINQVGIDMASIYDTTGNEDEILDVDAFKGIFHKDELPTFKNCSTEKLGELFTYYWSLKECYTKFTGTGLNYDLTKINMGEILDYDDSDEKVTKRRIQQRDVTFYSKWINNDRKEIVTICSFEGSFIKPRIFTLKLANILEYFESIKTCK
ncbi:holo-[acyl-carrier-protein] synthase NDAI_0H03420 [Naumovozyma dairenensis CBS 421]|uniref:holo-[acyl-carrier-protein] synthase n=1 Tax=Naumovozyma dairenensis (strain ATCC 10597 / BCRC 20456 / CBS 421 / NBRC 0211 / NRRL Y-12639) TaxID=1071378 RepID=G0WFF4_NAUDC|nr:hypothetical protein NDAI_0H03420 [Naumovozyma dairenensis CBS 421]CCD26515.1 hypothetical protein NDAI_0H03420 [Naumovozyma dairenensis CBS 421]